MLNMLLHFTFKTNSSNVQSFATQNFDSKFLPVMWQIIYKENSSTYTAIPTFVLACICPVCPGRGTWFRMYSSCSRCCLMSEPATPGWQLPLSSSLPGLVESSVCPDILQNITEWFTVFWEVLCREGSRSISHVSEHYIANGQKHEKG